MAIAGAGPVGLLLACELRLAGVSALVFDKLADPNLPIKAGAIGARALNIPSIEIFYRRGLLSALKRAALRWTERSALSGDLELRARGPAAAEVIISLQSLEALLTERAAELQVEIRRATAVTDVSADEDGVTVHAGGTAVRSRWLVGCDGGRSTVRKLAGFDFPGTGPGITGYAATVEIAEPEKLSSGWNRTGNGAYVNGPMPGRILTVEFDGPPGDRDAPVTLDELQSSLRKVSGTDVMLTAVHAATRWTDNARQASTYRLGRVLLAGDAAHVHAPIGGEGLNVGIGDAVNLGWKLAATVKGWTPETLLDTYTSERHPIGAWAIKWATAQLALMGPKRRGVNRTSVVRDLLGTGNRATHLAKKISGVWQRYELPGDHPLIGSSAPDLLFENGKRLGEYCRGGSALLFNFGEDDRISTLGARWSNQLTVVNAKVLEASGLTALFVRPDGVVAWAADKHLDLDQAALAMSRWLRDGN